jgi:hypothetical protein
MGKFDALTEFRKPEAVTKGREATPPEKVVSPGPTKVPARGQGPGRPTGKRSNPDYEQTTVFLKKATKKKAIRFLEDSGQKPDLSDLLQSLLDAHNSANA